MFDNLKETLLNFLLPLQEKIEDSETFQNLRQAYNDLSETKKKLVLVILSFLALFLLTLPSLSFFLSSQERLENFRKNYHLMEKLSSLQSVPALSSRDSVTFNTLKRKIESLFLNFSIGEEQLVSIKLERKISPPSSKQKSQEKDKDKKVLQKRAKKTTPSLFEKDPISLRLKNLTLKQAVQLGSALQKTGKFVRLESLEIEKSQEEEGYVDVKYILESYQIKDPPKPKQSKAPRKRTKRGSSR